MSQKNDFSLLMESWRKYSGRHSFERLCENFDRGIITEIELYETWDRQVMLEMQSLLDEGIVDTLKRGYEALKSGAKEEWEIIKHAYNAAAKKVADFIFNLEIQAWLLLQKAKIVASKIGAILMKVVNFVKKFCDGHPVLCKATFALIVLISITAVMGVMASPAMADITMPADDGGAPYTITDTGVNAIKGCLEVITRDGDPETQQLAVDAVEWMEQAHAATTSTDLSQLATEAQQQVWVCYKTVEKSTAEDPGMLSALARHGEKIMTLNNKFFREINGVITDHIEWQSLAEPGKGNVSPLAPQNIGSSAAEMFDALK
jgi:hypothetical protein